MRNIFDAILKEHFFVPLHEMSEPKRRKREAKKSVVVVTEPIVEQRDAVAEEERSTAAPQQTVDDDIAMTRNDDPPAQIAEHPTPPHPSPAAETPPHPPASETAKTTELERAPEIAPASEVVAADDAALREPKNPKKRGRPTGSKNKPKPPPNEEAKRAVDIDLRSVVDPRSIHQIVVDAIIERHNIERQRRGDLFRSFLP